MLDLEKVAQEFVFLREKIKEAAGFVIKNENAEAAFILGYLNSVCHSHAIAVSRLIPPKEQPTQEQNSTECEKSICD